ncbi:hypothetical protein N7509_012344 [Penicillium cosmopolitanum]|uniref:Uncharacterized protein n=1 Tax=Penicillium cosmopolitanum TaxID=1131564 RepID=A0A9W9VH35_9EURO|nr:uncharacterized protein N7509_012344 [Penicillium cosmopolitanum]KAJ5379225.1 hypothetical protein N7509_012344 [Penicillium cosmopolitanum]
MTSTPTILLLGTCDTKLPELLYTKSAILAQGPSKVLILDIGRTPSSSSEVDIKQSDLLNTQFQHNDVKQTSTPPPHPPTSEKSKAKEISNLDRDSYIKTLSPYVAGYISNLNAARQIHAVLAIGGSCGTALATAALRDGLPVGFPKLMVSTMASGDVGPYIGETDIAMMYSVVDIAGRNRVLDTVLQNAAGAVAGMGRVYSSQQLEQQDSEATSSVRIGISMFGVTTPAVTTARKHLESILPGCEVYVFHATGSGGRAMERLISEGQLDAVLDLTTTEIADEVVGGVLSAGPDRLVAATKRDIPRVVSVGACDMVNFGTFDSIPEKFANDGAKRVFHRHNPTVTLMRTTEKECRDIARVIARNIRGASRTKVLLPIGGVSMVDVPGQPFWNPDVDGDFFSALEEELCDSEIEIVKDGRDINHPELAKLAAEMLRDLIKVSI